MTQRIIVGITGASGVIYGLRLLEALHRLEGIETHLVVSNAARYIFKAELGDDALDKTYAYAHYCHDINDLSCEIASGSYVTSGMVVVPCSMKTLAAIAHGYSNNLLTRAADVMLKERRRIVLVVRETPLHLGHLENMAMVSRMGGIILPPIPAFYHRPQTIDDIVNHTVGKVLDALGLHHSLYRRWGS